MVACENGEDDCPNKGWLHPQCTDDLKHLSMDQIAEIDIWYCMDCRKKDQPTISNTDNLGSPQKVKSHSNSPSKTTQKKGGNICIESDPVEKKNQMSNDSSLKKQLIIKFTEEELDEKHMRNLNVDHDAESGSNGSRSR